MLPIEQRLVSHRRITSNGCWEWTGSLHANGYASTGAGKRNKRKYVHRISYELWIGPIAQGMDLDHLCRNRKCFNPAHLEQVTRRENALRGEGPSILARLNGAKTHCKNGNEFTPDNTRIRPTGGRACRACAKSKQAEYRRRAKQMNKNNTPEAIRNVAD